MAANASQKPASTEAEVVALPAAEAKPGAERPHTVPSGGAAPAPAKPRRSRRLLLMVAVPLVLAVGGGWFWLSGGRYVDTDNAYVQQTMVAISPDIAGRIVAGDVRENQTV
jgi:membrane fusion protein (multidrug efflux system)